MSAKNAEAPRAFKFLPLSLRLETLGAIATPLVLKGTPLPAKRVEVFTTAEDNQKSVELNVLMGESSLARKCISLGKFHLKGIPPGKRGEPQIRVTFEVDATCAVRATASVKEAHIEVSDELVPDPHQLTDESTERIRREDEQSQNEDKGTVSLIEARINAEAAIAKAEQLLESLHDSKAAVADPHGISTDIALLGEALQAEDVDRIREQTQRLQARLVSPRGIGLDSIFGDISFDSFFTRPPSARTFQQTSRPAKGPTKGQAQAARTSPRPDEIARTATQLPLGKIFGGGEFTLDPNLCFVLMPLAETFRPIYEDHIRPAVQSQGLRCLRADEIRGTSLITRDIWEMLNRARILVADLTGQNPNVFYEVGLAHALGKDVLLLTQTMTDVPFDMKAMRCIVYTYNPRGMKEMEEALKATVSALIRAA